MNIHVKYQACDGYREAKCFQSVTDASEWARHWIGDHPDVGRYYAVSFDGIGRITAEGCTLAELFPPKVD